MCLVKKMKMQWPIGTNYEEKSSVRCFSLLLLHLTQIDLMVFRENRIIMIKAVKKKKNNFFNMFKTVY